MFSVPKWITADVDRIASEVKARLNRGERVQALRFAMAAVEPLLGAPTDDLRRLLRKRSSFRSRRMAYPINATTSNPSTTSNMNCRRTCRCFAARRLRTPT